jgi:phytoene synthase
MDPTLAATAYHTTYPPGELAMQSIPHPWEHSLLARAHEAWHAGTAATVSRYDAALLRRAYAHCEQITAEYSRSFHLASGLLPPAKRRAVRALYAFCRVTDDLVDRAGPDPRQRLATARRHVLTAVPPEDDLLAVAWTDARLRFGIPLRYAEQLIDGVAQDLEARQYATFDELAAYSYGVASTVGLMSMHIVGFSSAAAMRYAIKLGVALQLTNILRDVAEDLAARRVYLPAEELDRFGVTISDLAAGRVTRQWRAFMRFQIARNRRLYAEAMPGIGYLHADGRLAITAAAHLYRAILDEIERRDYDVFQARASVSAWGKLRRLPAIWWQSRQAEFARQGAKLAKKEIAGREQSVR